MSDNLRLSNELKAGFQGLHRMDGVPDPVLPERAEAERLLVRLGVGDDDVRDALAARPDPTTDPELWWILEQVYHDLVAHMGCLVPIQGFGSYPREVMATGPRARQLPIWLYLAVLPHVQQFHAARGISEEVSWHSLGDSLRETLASNRRVTGESGLGLRGWGWSLPLRFRGVNYRLGRLEFHLGKMSLSDGACGYVNGVHIPAGARLEPAACDEAMAQAQTFFARYFPERPVSCFTCYSWLLDPQLAEYLDEGSNLVQFQRRFRLLPLAGADRERHVCDEDWLPYVFDAKRDASVSLIEQAERLPQDTTLRRAYVTHLRAGKHWYARTGWIPVED